MWVQLALFVISFIITALLAPKPKFENARPGSLDDVNFPQASAGTPVPYVLGRVRLRAPNTLWYGDFQYIPITEKVKTGLFGGSKKVTIGYRYFLGFDLGLCLGPVSLHRVWIDKDSVWEGTISTSGTSASINQPELFGGEERGGGFVGTMRFYTGDTGQSPNSYVEGQAGEDVPGYGGTAHAVFEGPYIGDSPQLRAMSFEVSHYTDALGVHSGRIGDDMNAIEALYQVMTDTWGGLGISSSLIDLDSFLAAAQQCYDEGNGISMIVTRPNDGKGLMQEILRQVDGIIYQDPQTAKMVLKLVRQDYDPLAVPDLDETNVVAINAFNRTSWATTYNQVRVLYTQRTNGYNAAAAMAQDMANISAQGRLRSTDVSFPCVYDQQNATRLATRELTQLSVPLYQVTLEANRQLQFLRPGDVFALAWSQYGIARMYLRVQRFSMGDLMNGKLVIDASQDIFALNETVYASPDDTLGVTPDRTPIDITVAMATETPEWMLARAVGVPASGRAFPLVLARDPGAYQVGYSANIDGVDVVNRVVWGGTAELVTSIAQFDGFSSGLIASIVIDAVQNRSPTTVSLSELRNGSNLFFIGNELMGCTGMTDNLDGTWTLTNVYRALLDTQYEAHAANDPIFFMDANGIADSDVSDSTTKTVKLLTFTDKGETDLSVAPSLSLVTNQRYFRPLPPDNLTWNLSRTPPTETSSGGRTVAWAGRTRGDTAIRLESDAGVTPEAGVTYTLRVYFDGVLQAGLTQTGLTGTSTTVALGAGVTATVQVAVSAVLGGLESRNPAIIEFGATT